jgi:hypothetical protein
MNSGAGDSVCAYFAVGMQAFLRRAVSTDASDTVIDEIDAEEMTDETVSSSSKISTSYSSRTV